ncbi:hypothetical protein PUR61_27205 [Streptomyces sp. BE20]|uniref:hypothetical protein n=1 Tax=Streptomyces sp. BE20 TaxID=3002525 RepID=UPI002E7A5CE7|nr:hypothetical protein [Streptomyces sp. BE20]MEE1825849.1 hypothetical protein [Streptomyces sp. BE20]
MGDLIPIPRPHIERTTVPYLTVESVPDADLQLRLPVDLDINAAPGDHLAVPLTRAQARDLLESLTHHLGYLR